MELKPIAELVREAQQNDRLGTTTSSKYVTTSMREDIDTTEAYLNSKHISGDTDYLGREKPFFNIVTAARNIWYRATDIDRKNITIRATKDGDQIKSLLATIKFQDWMKRSGFGKFLNDWGLTLSSHGSAVVEFVEQGGELKCSVLNWNDIIVDAVDFEANPVIKRLWYTPAQLKMKKEYNQEMVDQLIDSTTTRKTMEGTKKDNKADFIEVFEVHGKLPLYYLTEKDSDKDEYVQQIHVLSFNAKNNDSTGFSDYTLYSGKLSKSPHMLTHLIKKDGQTYSGGAVKAIFEAQWMVNHTQKMIKDQLELASKIVFQTSDGSLGGANILSDIENGDILNHKQGEPLTMLNNKPDIAAMQAFQGAWQNAAAQINGISEAMMGENPPAGSAWRQTQALLQESHSLFEIMRENKGLYIEEMLREYVIPYFKKQLNNSDEISAILEDWQIKEIDSRYIPNEAIRRINDKKKQTILSGQIYDPTQEGVDLQTAMSELQSGLRGNQRFIKPSDIEDVTWKEVFKDLEWDLDIDVTGESKDVQGALATLTTVLQTLAGNPAVVQDPNIKLVFNKILSLAGGISPLEMQEAQKMPSVGQPAQAQQPVPQFPQPTA